MPKSIPSTPIDSPYDRSKAVADSMVREWARRYGMPCIVLRFCNVYGPFDRHRTRIVPGTLQAIAENRAPTLRKYRDSAGEIQSFRLDLIYVEDLMAAISLITRKLQKGGPAASGLLGEAFNLGTNHCYPMDEVIDQIQRAAGNHNPPAVEMAQMNTEIMEQCMSYEKAERAFGFVPKTTLDEGLRRTVAWWRKEMGVMMDV